MPTSERCDSILRYFSMRASNFHILTPYLTSAGFICVVAGKE